MKVQFKQAAHIKGKDYQRGHHHVDKAVMDHPFFQKLVKAGMIVVGEAEKSAESDSMQDRNKKLAEMLASKSVPAKGPESLDPIPSDEASDGGAEESASPSEAHEPEAKEHAKKHKHKR